MNGDLFYYKMKDAIIKFILQADIFRYKGTLIILYVVNYTHIGQLQIGCNKSSKCQLVSPYLNSQVCHPAVETMRGSHLLLESFIYFILWKTVAAERMRLQGILVVRDGRRSGKIWRLESSI